MIVEAILWSVAALGGPDLFGMAMRRWGIIAGGPWISFGRYLRSLAIPYLALITGAVAARELGLTGHAALEWFRGSLICGGVLAIAWVAAGWRGAGWPYARPEEAALDEPRWALYRGTGSLLADPRWAGPLIGLGLGVIEWTLSHRPWIQGGRWPRTAWSVLARIGGSTALFLLTRNLWLIMITQVGLSLILAGSPRKTHEDRG